MPKPVSKVQARYFGAVAGGEAKSSMSPTEARKRLRGTKMAKLPEKKEKKEEKKSPAARKKGATVPSARVDYEPPRGPAPKRKKKPIKGQEIVTELKRKKSLFKKFMSIFGG